jgi:hypothetical protein
MKRILRILQSALVCSLPVLAAGPSENGVAGANQKQQATAAIFDEIMQTLPPDMKARVDSASAGKKNDSKNTGKGSARASAGTQKQRPQTSDRDAAVQQLPEDVRAKVEKAISDIDLMNQDRQIQFKDYEKKRQGGK